MQKDSFGKRLKNIREFLGISQVELSKKTGFSPQNICHFEAGRREPNLSNLVRLALALKVTSDVLLGIDMK